jgi:hypothetical protein
VVWNELVQFSRKQLNAEIAMIEEEKQKKEEENKRILTKIRPV